LWRETIDHQPWSNHPSNFGPFKGIVTGQHKVPPDSADAYKFGKQGRRELDRCATEALDDDLIDRPTVVVQVLLLREVKSKFKLLHVRALKTIVTGFCRSVLNPATQLQDFLASSRRIDWVN
jgi:hypothetical protein